jgi:phytoene dehydrogenase-like protein
VLERASTPGGGARTAELTLPGFVHDVCSAIHPLAVGGPFFARLNLERWGLKWIQPELPFAHPLDDGSAPALHRSVERTADSLGADGARYRALFAPWVEHWQDVLNPLLERWRFPRRPFLLAEFGWHALSSIRGFADRNFDGRAARALFAGAGGHVISSFDQPMTASMPLMLHLLGHSTGWPLPEGGSRKIIEALVALLTSLGGELHLDHDVRSLVDVPESRVVLFDVTPSQLLAITGDHFHSRFRRSLARFRHGPGVFKLDYALSAPIPWRADSCRRAGTVHLGGTLEEIAAAEQACVEGRVPEKPYILVAQPSVFDSTRAPPGQHTAWVYCHVPHGSSVDMTSRIEAQLERFAPGFRDRVLARHSLGPHALQLYNPNYVGGDIAAGSHDGLQLLARPRVALNPYETADPRFYLCSASTPPGAGVHGMCGWNAARAVLRRYGPSGS